MTSETTIKLSPKDLAMIDQFAGNKFKSRSEFITYAVKKTIYEMLLEEFHDQLGTESFPTEEEVQRLHAEIKEIRKELWKQYAEDLP